MSKPVFEIITYKGERRIKVSFEFSGEWNKRIKAVPGAKWSKTLRSWHIPDTEENRKKCGLSFAASGSSVINRHVIQSAKPAIQNKKAIIQNAKPPIQSSKQALSYISAGNKEAMNKFLQTLQLKAYSPSTIRTYRLEFAQLLQTIKNYAVDSLTVEQLKKYFQYCINKGASEHTIHSRINAVKFYFEEVLKREKMFFEIPRPKKPLQLPKVMSREEIATLIKAIDNLKHKTMIILAYGCGLRVSEITALTIADVDGGRRLLMIKRGKGKKDRVISLSPALLVMMREYYKIYKPKHILFSITSTSRSCGCS